ncbi:MAG: DUF4390 domain-containing protein [Desulfopila sp.]|nr:DUF4390 domain-containing protein [Desulfopila sp.]
MKKALPLLFFILLLFCATVQNAVSVPKKLAEPAFSNITVTSSNSHLLLFAMLEDAFTHEMLQGLHSGIPIHFSFFIELFPTGKNRNDDRISTIEIRHVIGYDTLKETYKVELEESGKRFFTFEKVDEAQKAINEINGLKIVELTKLHPDTSYTVRIRAELYKKTLPMGLHTVVPFISWWDVKTKWHSITFKL